MVGGVNGLNGVNAVKAVLVETRHAHAIAQNLLQDHTGQTARAQVRTYKCVTHRTAQVWPNAILNPDLHWKLSMLWLISIGKNPILMTCLTTTWIIFGTLHQWRNSNDISQASETTWT